MLFILFAISVAPGLAIILFIYMKDKYEKEPRSYLFKCFLMGVLSIIPAVILSLSFEGSLTLESLNIPDQFIKAFFVVALAEEGAKFFFVRVFAYRNSNFNEPFDGIIYAVMVSMGFATAENILYVFSDGIGTGILRMFTAVPAHASFAIIMGYFLGLAKFSKNSSYLALLGLSGAILFHGAYDFFLFTAFVPGMIGGALVSLVLGIVLSFWAIKIHQKSSPFNEKVIR